MPGQPEKVKADGTIDIVEARSSGPRTLKRVLPIANHLARAPRGLSLSELAIALDAPKCSLLGLLRALVEMQFTVREGDCHLVGPARSAYPRSRFCIGFKRQTELLQPHFMRLHDCHT